MDLAIVLSSGLLIGGIYAFIAIGLNLIFGVIRVANFAQGEFVMLGMFITYLIQSNFQIDPYISAWLIVAPLGFILGALVYILVIRRLLDDHYMQMFATFGLIYVFQNLVLSLSRGEAKQTKSVVAGKIISVFGLDVSIPRLMVLLVSIAIAYLLTQFLKRTMIGTAMRAVAQDQKTSTLMGINTNRIYLLTFGISAALAAMAGALLTPSYGATSQIGFGFVLPAFAVVVLGGLGSVKGSLIGGILIGVVEGLAGYLIDPQIKQAVWFTLFLIVLVIRPNGLFGKSVKGGMLS
jgi:branched-chain amino acid transport system permease protein